MDSILKFIFYARKHPEKELHNRYNEFKILNSNSDFDWHYEGAKSEVVQKLCTVEATKKQIVNTWKHYKKELCYYPEFYSYARYLLKEGKKKDYKSSWTDILL